MTAPEITKEQMAALLALLEGWRNGGPFPRFSELTEKTGLPRNVLKEVIEGMEAQGLADGARSSAPKPAPPRAMKAPPARTAKPPQAARPPKPPPTAHGGRSPDQILKRRAAKKARAKKP